jgi:hypothetical protein
VVKMCKRGHEMTQENTTKDGSCKACIALNGKAYREANRERIAAKKKAYNDANKENRRAYYEANKENRRAYHEANKEKIAAHHKAYCEANKEKLAAQQKAHREDNREKIATYNRRMVKSIADSYVAGRMGLPVKDIPQEVIEVKRLLITIKRELKNGKQHSNKHGE